MAKAVFTLWDGVSGSVKIHYKPPQRILPLLITGLLFLFLGFITIFYNINISILLTLLGIILVVLYAIIKSGKGEVLKGDKSTTPIKIAELRIYIKPLKLSEYAVESNGESKHYDIGDGHILVLRAEGKNIYELEKLAAKLISLIKHNKITLY